MKEDNLKNKLETAIISYYEKEKNWPYGKKLVIPIYKEKDCPFIGPCITYKCDKTRKRIRSLTLEAFSCYEDFVSELTIIHKGRYDDKYKSVLPLIKYIAEVITK